MRFLKTSMIILITMMLVIAFASCSGSSKSQSPLEPSFQVSDLPSSFGTDDTSGRSFLAVYDAVIDPIAKTFIITPEERTADYHIPLTQLYPNVLKIVGYGWTPNFWVDIKLTHPFPGSGIDGFDPRVIAIVPTNTENQMFFPIFNVLANNKIVLEPDGYTKLFDNLGGSIPGNTNPFKAYFKDQSYRIWSSTGITSETQRWNLNLAGFGGPMQYKLLVDVSTNYPYPPQSVIDNAPEPVEIKTYVGLGMTSQGESAEIDVTLLDWQGYSNLKCKIEAPDLFNSAVQLFFSNEGQNPNEYVFSGTITNELQAPAGEYRILIAVWDIPSDIHIFDEAIVNVEPVPSNPIDITPPDFNFSGYKLCGSNAYAYVVGSYKFHIIDINPPEEAYVVKSIVFDYGTYDVDVWNDYAFIANHNFLKVIDINPPEEAYIVNSKYISGGALNIAVSNGYAYIGGSGNVLGVYDVTQPMDITNIAGISITNIKDICISGNYAYVTSYFEGLDIVDIDPPEDLYVMKTVDSSYAIGVHVVNGYAYVTCEFGGLNILDIDPIESASLVKEVETCYEKSVAVFVFGSYAYVTHGNYGLYIVDTVPLEESYVYYVNDQINVSDIYVSDGYAFMADSDCGLRILDLW